MKGFSFRYLSVPSYWAKDELLLFLCLILSAEQRQSSFRSISTRRSQHQRKDQIFLHPSAKPKARMGGSDPFVWLFKDWLDSVVSYHSIISLKWFAPLLGMVLVPSRLTQVCVCIRLGKLHLAKCKPGVESVEPKGAWRENICWRITTFRRIQVHCYMCNVCDLLVQVNGWWFSYLARTSISEELGIE